jgi:hypothetical protein
MVDRPIVQARRDPPAELPQQPEANIGASPLFSQIEDEYLAIRENGGASAGAISTARWRTSVFKTLVGDRPLDAAPATGFYRLDVQQQGLRRVSAARRHDERLGHRIAVDLGRCPAV